MNESSQGNTPSKACWQLAQVPLPISIEEGASGPHRPVGCFVGDLASRYCFKPEIAPPETGIVELAMMALNNALADCKGRWPAVVQVRDPELATALRPVLAPHGTRIEVQASLEVIDEIVESFMDHFGPESAMPNWLEVPGTTPDLLRYFAKSAAMFHDAARWKLLHDDDVIVIESPAAPKGMGCASVMGAGGQVFGIGFHESTATANRMLSSDTMDISGPRYSLMFYDPHEMPPADAELWEELGLPTGKEPERIPLLFRFDDGTPSRPSAEHTRFVSGLCYAISKTTEEQIDSGRWEQTVPTPDGPVVFKLSIPHLLAKPVPLVQGPMADPREMEQTQFRFSRMAKNAGCTTEEQMRAFAQKHLIGKRVDQIDNPFTDPKDIALDMCYSSLRHYSRRRVLDLHEALKLDPGCAEAYVMLAELSTDQEMQRDLYRRGVEAGRLRLGTAAFADPTYPFWGTIESRPFMRALKGLALVNADLNRYDDCIAGLRELLELNPGDNQGARYILVDMLIAAGRLGEAVRFVRTPLMLDDVSALGPWVEAAYGFIEDVDSDLHLLQKAVMKNALVPECLRDENPGEQRAWSPGSIEEADWIAETLVDAFETADRLEEFIARAEFVVAARNRRARRAERSRPAAKKPKRKKK